MTIFFLVLFVVLLPVGFAVDVAVEHIRTRSAS